MMSIDEHKALRIRMIELAVQAGTPQGNIVHEARALEEWVLKAGEDKRVLKTVSSSTAS